MGRKVEQHRRADPASFAEFARRAGVNRSSVTRLVASKLAGALTADGRIDASHPSVAAWARARGIKPAALLSRQADPDDAPTLDAIPGPAAPRAPTARRPRAAEPDAAPLPNRPGTDAPAAETLTGATLETYMDMSLRQIAAQFGNLRGYADEVDALKNSESAYRLHLQNAESEGQLIGRDFVRGHVFSWLDGFARKLLSDAAKTGSKRVYGLAKSGATAEQAEQALREVLSSHLKTVKAQIAKTLRDA